MRPTCCEWCAPPSIGLLDDSIVEMGDAWGVDDPDEVQCHAPGFETVQQADAATQYHGDQADDQLVHKPGPEALLHDACPLEEHVLACGCRPRFRTGAFDALGDERVRRIARRHGLGD